MLSLLKSYIQYILYIFRIQRGGQSEIYEIMQLAHRLEKGLVNQNPKPMWGWEKAERLSVLLASNQNSISYETGLSVLQKYLENKRYVEQEKELVENLEEKYKFSKTLVPGGSASIEKRIFTRDELVSFENIIKSRHSTRNFDSKDIDISKLNEAINLALHSPSACNRQAYNLYVVLDEKRRNIGVEDVSAASIYVTGVIDAYTRDEMLDWIVSPSIFVGYLTLTLHVHGFGACIYRKDLVRNTDYNKKVKKLCSIPDNEQLILEIRIGSYPKTINTAVSNRFSFKQITHYI